MTYVLEATRETQGSRDNDYAWTVDGELVFVPFIDCCDERCGCARGFAGITSHRATTTARVVDRPDLDAEEYHDLLVEGMESQGYAIRGDGVLEDMVDEVAAVIELFGGILGPGTVIGRSGTSLIVRAPGRPGAAGETPGGDPDRQRRDEPRLELWNHLRRRRQ